MGNGKRKRKNKEKRKNKGGRRKRKRGKLKAESRKGKREKGKGKRKRVSFNIGGKSLFFSCDFSVKLTAAYLSGSIVYLEESFRLLHKNGNYYVLVVLIFFILSHVACSGAQASAVSLRSGREQRVHHDDRKESAQCSHRLPVLH